MIAICFFYYCHSFSKKGISFFSFESSAHFEDIATIDYSDPYLDYKKIKSNQMKNQDKI